MVSPSTSISSIVMFPGPGVFLFIWLLYCKLDFPQFHLWEVCHPMMHLRVGRLRIWAVRWVEFFIKFCARLTIRPLSIFDEPSSTGTPVNWGFPLLSFVPCYFEAFSLDFVLNCFCSVLSEILKLFLFYGFAQFCCFTLFSSWRWWLEILSFLHQI